MKKDSDNEVVVTVNDRRMFNPDGSLRLPLVEETRSEVLPPVEIVAPASPVNAVAPMPEPEPMPEEEVIEPSPEFGELLQMLATNAIINLGAAPQLGRTQIDIESARHFIEMIAVLQEKTQGNLAPEEQQMLTDMLSRLRMEYLSVVNQMSKSAKKQL